MPVQWETGETEAYKIAAKAAKAHTEDFDSENQVWLDFCYLREAMIWALLVVKFPAGDNWKISQKNWEEIYRRLYLLEKVNGPYRVFCVPDKDDPTKASATETREEYFTPEEIHSMIGLSVNAGNLTDAKFKNYIYKEWVAKAAYNLKKFEEERDVQADNTD